jgi:hypothetical protein
MTLQRVAGFSTVALVTALACLVLALLRVGAETSWHEPKHRPTSGLEEEALFSVWKVSQHQPVYADPFQIPYAISYFNWLFYATYGLAGTFALSVLKVDSGWLPTATRSLSFILTLGCGVAFFQVAREGRFWPKDWTWLDKIALSTIAVFNPLFGFFNFTTRPDAGALLFELAGLALVLRYWRSQNRLTLIEATLVLYCAWAFKQSAVTVVAGTCLWFLWRRRFSDFFLVAGISAGLYAATFLIGGPNYYYAVVKSQANCGFQILVGLENFAHACLKSPFLPLALLSLPVSWFLGKHQAKTEGGCPLPVIFVFSLVWCGALSFKIGASDYYFLEPALFGILWLVGICAAGKPFRFFQSAIAVGLCLQLAAVGLILGGRAGVIADPPEQERHRELALQLDKLPGPVLVSERFGNLPWIQRKPPHFVYAFTYHVDRQAGLTYDHGGLGGLIRRRYFKTVVMRNSATPPLQASFDGQSLSEYDRAMSVAGYDFYVLRESVE